MLTQKCGSEKLTFIYFLKIFNCILATTDKANMTNISIVYVLKFEFR